VSNLLHQQCLLKLKLLHSNRLLHQHHGRRHLLVLNPCACANRALLQQPRSLCKINIRRASEIHVSYNYKKLKMLSSLPVLSFFTPSQPLLERAKYTKLTPECMQACSHQLQQANELIMQK
jgi:hypothetical protein